MQSLIMQVISFKALVAISKDGSLKKAVSQFLNSHDVKSDLQNANSLHPFSKAE